MKQLNDLFNRFFATAGIILMLLCSVVPSTFAFQAVDMNVVPSNIEVVKVGSVTPISVATCVDSDVGGLNYNVYGYSQGNKEGTDKYSRYYDSCGEAVGDSGKDKGDRKSVV